MRDGYKVFDADAHVVEPKDLWERFLDAEYKPRVSWRQPFEGMDRFRPVTVDGRYTQSTKTLYGRQQAATVRAANDASRPPCRDDPHHATDTHSLPNPHQLY